MRPYFEYEGITIYHADCREVLPGLAEPSLVIADPPYGISQVQKGRTPGPDLRRGRWCGTWRAWEPITGDEGPFDPSHLLVYRRLVLFGANYYADRLPPSASWIVWDKRNGATPDDNADAELLWTNLSGPVRLYRQCWRGFTREGDQLEGSERHLHPTQKPIALMQWLVQRFTEPGALVIDPYLGCGPVAVACRNLGRRCIGIEIRERYCEVAALRLAQGVLPLEFAA